MDSDRELLEAAARAAGYRATALYGSGFHVAETETADFSDFVWWNPLKSNGDAFKLQVKLLLRVSVNRAMGLNLPGSVTVEYPDQDGFYFAIAEAVTGDPLAATRRAIVRAAARSAAAELGRRG